MAEENTGVHLLFACFALLPSVAFMGVWVKRVRISVLVMAVEKWSERVF